MTPSFFSPLPFPIFRGLFLFVVVAAAPPVLFSQPKIFFPGGVTYQLGTIMEDTKFHKTITVGNHGDDTLRLSGIRTSCGCTVAKSSADVVPPGGRVSIDVIINTKNFVDGRVKKDIYFETNDTTMPKADIVFNLIIRSIIQFIPTYVNFSNISLGGTSEQKVIVKNNAPRKVTIDSIHSKNSQIIVNVKKLTILPGHSASFSTVLHGNKPGNVLGQFDVYTNYPPKPLVNLSYVGYIKK